MAGMLMAGLLLLLPSCTQSDVEEGGGSSGNGREVEATFGLDVLSSVSTISRSLQMTTKSCIQTDSLSVGEEELVATRATADLGGQESRIQTLWAGQYNKTGTLIKEQYLSELTSQSEVNLRLAESSEGQTLYLVANAGDLSGKAGTINTLLGLTRDYSSTDDGLPDGNSCMMIGSWNGKVIPGGLSGTVELTRLVAKIRFTYSIGGTGFTFTPSSVKLCSVPAKSRLGEPDDQLAGITYREYSGISSAGGATVYWYLPENRAGTVTGGNAVDSEKRKTGRGVTKATYVELTGTAVQDGVTYQDVCFRLYPGSNANDYTIGRNCYYTISLTLDGIDFSDERISVGVIPPIQNPDNLGAEKGAGKALLVTSQPGKSWSFGLPDWLSAAIGTTNIAAGGTVSHEGPVVVGFTAATANPKAESRTASFVIDNQEVMLTQNPSSLTAGNSVSLSAAGGSTGNSSFTATAGLPWAAALSSEWGDWLIWQAGAPSSGEASGTDQPLSVRSAASNPSATSRSGKITVKGGAAIDPGYAGLTGQITVTQAGATVTGSSAPVKVAAAATENLSSTFRATQDLSWEATVTQGNTWLSLVGTVGSSNTTGNDQPVGFKTVSPNPSSTARSGKITVRAGNAPTTTYPGPSGEIVIEQAGATLTVAAATKTVAATASSGTLTTFTPTKGLSWSLGVSSTNDWLSLSAPTSGTNTTGTAENLNYSAVVNPNASTREGTITVKAGNAVGGTDAALTKTVTVTQSASSLTASASVTTLGATKDASGIFKLTGTAGLGITITPPFWITLSGTVPATTTGIEQSVGYKTNEVNPNGVERSGTTSVKVGNITNSVTLKQSSSDFSVSSTSLTLTKGGTAQSVKVTDTAGLAWTVSKTGDAAISSGSNGSSGTEDLSFSATENKGDARNATFTISATGASPERILTVKVEQEKGLPQNMVGNIQVAPASTTIQIVNNDGMKCSSLNVDGFTNWRAPTFSELQAIYKGNSALGPDYSFAGGVYWSSTCVNLSGEMDVDCLDFSTGAKVVRVFEKFEPAPLTNFRCIR